MLFTRRTVSRFTVPAFSHSAPLPADRTSPADAAAAGLPVTAVPAARFPGAAALAQPDRPIAATAMTPRRQPRPSGLWARRSAAPIEHLIPGPCRTVQAGAALPRRAASLGRRLAGFGSPPPDLLSGGRQALLTGP